MCYKAVRIEPILLWCVPDHFKTQEMCNELVHAMSKAFRWIPERFKTQEICIKAVQRDSSMLKYVPDLFKMGSS